MNYHKINKICNSLFRPKYKYYEKMASVKYVTSLYLNFYEKDPETIKDIIHFLEDKFIDITIKYILNNKNETIVKKRLQWVILFLDYPETFKIRNMYLDYRDYYVNFK